MDNWSRFNIFSCSFLKCVGNAATQIKHLIHKNKLNCIRNEFKRNTVPSYKKPHGNLKTVALLISNVVIKLHFLFRVITFKKKNCFPVKHSSWVILIKVHQIKGKFKSKLVGLVSYMRLYKHQIIFW